MAPAVQRRHQQRTPPKPMKIDPKHFRFAGGKPLTLAKWPTLTDPVYKSQKDYKRLLQAQVSELDDLQHLLYASDSYSLLLIFQAMDAAGKDGAISHLLLHNRSGAGSDIFAADINKEGEMDILTATRFGTFVFRGKAGAVKPARER